MAFCSPTHCVEEMMTFRNFYTLRSGNEGILQFYTLHLGYDGIRQVYTLH